MATTKRNAAKRAAEKLDELRLTAGVSRSQTAWGRYEGACDNGTFFYDCAGHQNRIGNLRSRFHDRSCK